MLRRELVLILVVGCTLVCCYSPPLLIPQSPAHNLHPFYPQENQLQGEDELWWRGKKTGPSLSVVNPIEVLRSRLMLEMARRKMQTQGNEQLQANRLLLKTIGKRQLDRSSGKGLERYDYSQDSGADWNSL